MNLVCFRRRNGVENRERQILVVLLIFFLVIVTMPTVGTKNNLALAGPFGAELTGVIDDQGVDEDGDGLFDYLKVGVQVNVTDPGNYYVYISDLLDSNSEYINVYASNFTFLDAGLQIVYLYLEGPRIYLCGRNPSYVNYIELRDEKYTSYDYLNKVPLSKEYSYTEFDPPTAMLTGRIYDRGVDTDIDGAFNYLEIGVEINVTKPGTYEVHVSELRDIHENWIYVWGSGSGYFDVGLGVLNVSLHGPSIYAYGLNPRYVNYVHLFANYYSSLYDIPLSREYLYTEFDFPAILTGVIFDQGVDTDADGSFDYLEVEVQVNVSDPGTYVLYVSGLLDANSSYISVWDSKTIYLDAGVQTVKLYVYGPQIYVTRRNPTTVSHISLSEKQYTYYRYYDSLSDVPLSKEYLYTQFDVPFVDVETKFIVYPDGRIGVEGAVKYTDMVPRNRGPTAQGSLNLTSTQASADLTVNLPPEIANEFPYNSTTADLLAKYSNGLLDLRINSTMILPPVLASQYPFNSTDGTLKATYSEGTLSIEAEGNTTLPESASQQFLFNTTDITVVGTYSPNTLNGTITFSVLPDFTFDDVNVGFIGNQTDFTLNGTVHIVFNVPFGDFMIHNETELIQKIDELKSELLGEEGIVWNMTGGLLNVTNLDIDHILNGVGASITFKMDLHGDFVRALAYLMSGGRKEMFLSPALNEAYQSVQSGSFDIRYSYTTREASTKLTFSYDLKRLIDYILTPPTGTTPYIMASYSMSPTIYLGDLVFVEAVSNVSNISADPDTGDIIALRHPDDSRYIIIHRAINKTQVDDTWYFQTKGDANSSPDYWTGNNTYDGLISENYLIGNISSRIPLLGYVLSYPHSLYYFGYYIPYLQGTVASRMSLLKSVFTSVQNMSIQLSYSSVDKRFDFQLTQVDKIKALADEIALILPEILPPETPPEVRTFIESLLNTTYASVDSAIVSFTYENDKADFEATTTIEGDINAEVNYVKDLYFQLIAAQYRGYNITIPWQAAFINQTKLDVSNFKISAKLGETSFESKIKGLTLMPPTDALNATHFKLEKFFNLTAPQYSWQQEFPAENQRLKITIEGGSNATHGVTLFRDPQTVPEPDATVSHQMIWYNQTLSSLKDLVFNIEKIPVGTVDGTVIDASTDLPIVGASINIDGYSTTTDSTGYYIITDVPAVTYTVTASITGYLDGVATDVVVTAGETITVNFQLASIPSTGTLSVTTTPVTGEVFVNDASWGFAPQSRVVQVGTYIVSFGGVDGSYTPANQVATINENVETTIEGVYKPLPEVVVEEITEPELVNATHPFIVNATEEAATSLVISEISDPITIVVQNVTEPEGIEPPPGTWRVLGNYVQITVNNTDITVNATIRIHYTLEQLETSELNESTLEIRFWNATSGEWESVESHVNTEEHYVWAIIDHFSLFAIFGQPVERGAPIPAPFWLLTIAIIVIIAVILVSVIYIRRRKTAITNSK